MFGSVAAIQGGGLDYQECRRGVGGCSVHVDDVDTFRFESFGAVAVGVDGRQGRAASLLFLPLHANRLCGTERNLKKEMDAWKLCMVDLGV